MILDGQIQAMNFINEKLCDIFTVPTTREQAIATKDELRCVYQQFFDVARLLDEHAPSAAREAALAAAREMRTKFNL